MVSTKQFDQEPNHFEDQGQAWKPWAPVLPFVGDPIHLLQGSEARSAWQEVLAHRTSAPVVIPTGLPLKKCLTVQHLTVSRLKGRNDAIVPDLLRNDGFWRQPAGEGDFAPSST